MVLEGGVDWWYHFAYSTYVPYLAHAGTPLHRLPLSADEGVLPEQPANRSSAENIPVGWEW